MRDLFDYTPNKDKKPDLLNEERARWVARNTNRMIYLFKDNWAVFLFIAIFISFLVSVNRSEISNTKYARVAEWTKQYPAIVEHVQDMMDDGKISEFEFDRLREVVRSHSTEQLKRTLIE